MDDVELIAIGLAVSLILILIEARAASAAERVALGGVTLLLASLALNLMKLNITQNAVDFLDADIGVILGVGVLDVGGFIPPQLRQ
jgi:hypothetical protein